MVCIEVNKVGPDVRVRVIVVAVVEREATSGTRRKLQRNQCTTLFYITVSESSVLFHTSPGTGFQHILPVLPFHT
ncbi:hypothetical protein D3C72_2119570 [compost metagenome]